MTASIPTDATPPGPIRLRYFLRIPNVGDRINPVVVAGLSGAPTRFTAQVEAPHLLCIGSLMSVAGPSSVVWGTGVMHPDLGLGSARNDNIFAVRGSLSAAALRGAGLLDRDVPLGDPGLLAPRLMGIERAPHPRHALGVAAHYVDRSHPAVRRLLAMDGVRDLDVRLEPADFLAAMADCRAVASSSLHGLVFAEALGLPSLWITASDDVAGDGFKFRDWFTTCGNPQAEPRRLDADAAPDALVRQAEPRGSTVSCADLAAAFPRGRLDEVRDATPCRVSISTARRRPPVPVFVISYNRGAMLLRCLAGLRHLDRPTRPVIHDNGSTDPGTLAILARLEAEGVAVFRGPAIATPRELNGVDRTVGAFFAAWSEPVRYVVTDCDIDLSVAGAAALDVYDELLDTFRRVDCAGPMLRIRDIPPSYGLYNRVMNRHIEQFWQRRPTWVDTSRGRIAVQECPIDTTFALHRAGEPFRRMKNSVRVYEPYEALHLDWYDEARGLDGSYHATSHQAISHWNNRTALERHASEPLRFDTFVAVRRTAAGDLEEYACPVARPA